jgi:hypothetical protein
MQDVAVSTADCIEFCGSTNVIDFSAGFILCSDVPGCTQPSTTAAPAASPYGIAAVLTGLFAVGLWRLRS